MRGIRCKVKSGGANVFIHSGCLPSYTDIWGGGGSGMRHVRGSSINEYLRSTVNMIRRTKGSLETKY